MGNFMAILWGLVVGILTFFVILALSCIAGPLISRASDREGLALVIWIGGFVIGIHSAIRAGVAATNSMAKHSDE